MAVGQGDGGVGETVAVPAYDRVEELGRGSGRGYGHGWRFKRDDAAVIVMINIQAFKREVRLRPSVAITHSSILDLIFGIFGSDDDLLLLPVLVVETDGEYVETLFDDLDGEVALTGFEGDDLIARGCRTGNQSPFRPHTPRRRVTTHVTE